MSLVLFSLPFLAIASVFLVKGLYVYFALSAVLFYQFVFTCCNKKYIYLKALMYDLLLTALLFAMGTYLPVLNFVPLTYKNILVFWNFYIGLIIFGSIASRVLIRQEMVE